MLEDILDIAALYAGRLYVELKSADPAAVIDCLTRHDAMDRCFFWSHDLSQIRQLRDQMPDADIMVRRQDLPGRDAVLAMSPAVVEFRPDDDPAEFDACRAAGAEVMVAYMGRDMSVFARLRDMAPDMVNLPHPFAFRRWLAAQT